MSGFRASRSLTGNTSPTLYRIDVTPAAGNTYYVGDPVRLASGTNKVVPATAAGSAAILGIIQGVGKIAPDGTFSPLTFNQPTAGNYLAASVTGAVLVNVDPNQLYTVRIDSSASAGLVGKSIRGSAGTANTRAGISGWTLNAASGGTTAGQMFKIVGIAPTDTTQGGNWVEVKLNRNIMALEVDAGI